MGRIADQRADNGGERFGRADVEDEDSLSLELIMEYLLMQIVDSDIREVQRDISNPLSSTQPNAAVGCRRQR